MKRKLFIFLTLFPLIAYSQTDVYPIPSLAYKTGLEKGLGAIEQKDIEKHLEILASDSLEGRRAGTPGGNLAAEYIKNELVNIGIKPWKGSYYQPFSMDNRRTPVSLEKAGNNAPHMRNVLGYIQGKISDEIVMIGAHYDHLGIRKNQTNDSIYNGADDNASGAVAVLEIAKAFMESGEKPERTIIFAFWDGEEIGLLGSIYFANDYYTKVQPPLLNPIPIKGHINVDMIGRDKSLSDTQHVACMVSDDTPQFTEWIKEGVEEYNLKLDTEFRSLDKIRGGSDHMPFQQKGVPVIFFHTDMHPDYHKPSDHTEKINFSKMTEITKLAFITLWRMANEDIPQ